MMFFKQRQPKSKVMELFQQHMKQQREISGDKIHPDINLKFCDVDSQSSDGELEDILEEESGDDSH